ncbi:lysozyme inhibitor LprI family protein [Acinetobacter sp. MB5]|uniref:lysozyme inhibitor LprI family protein n=1 Tax=Acinetobacter sp. MB5 TaxID=2069438 RepID=UPI000DD0D8DE|nr:lysozyme inhibitor LprI family protein [Acinetobacter sp. MB5]
MKVLIVGSKFVFLSSLFLVNICFTDVLDAQYNENDKILNQMYRDISSILKNDKFELSEFKGEQVSWLKERNFKCNFNGYSKPLRGSLKCLNDYNLLRVSYLSENYLIKPNIFYNNIFIPSDSGLSSKCMCQYKSIYIRGDQLGLKNSCDKGFEFYKVLNKKYIGNYGVQFDVDINGNKVSDFSVVFISAGKKTWRILLNSSDMNFIKPSDFSDKYILNFKKNKKDECGDFDG